MDEAAELVSLWGSALAGASAREAAALGGAAGAAPGLEDEAEQALEEEEEDGGEEWGLPLLGVDLTQLARGGFGRAEAEGLGFAALLSEGGGCTALGGGCCLHASRPCPASPAAAAPCLHA